VRFGNRTSVREGIYLQAITEYEGVRYNPLIEVGDDVYVGRHAFFTATDRISIGTDVF
jgi:acetyltransferase-like isoleucine patch superfamily enzyme